jgi:hypothetical protein
VEHTWRGRIGATLLCGLVGALIGYVLSETQGSHPQRWPWVVVGAVLVAALGLLLWERVHRWRVHRHLRRQAERSQRETAEAIKRVSQANRRRELERQAEQKEENRRWRPTTQIGTPPAPWGSETPILWLHIPHNDMYADHVGETVVCEVWRSAYVHKSATEIEYDANHGTFRAVFPTDFMASADPWRTNPEPPGGFGGLRDGEYVVVWRSRPGGAAIATTSFWYSHGLYLLFATNIQPARAGGNSGMGSPIS